MRKYIVSIILLASSICPLPSSAAPALGLDPIYANWHTCMKSQEGQSTVGMLRCAQRAIDHYDHVMRVLCKKLEQRSDWVDPLLLAASQRQWIQFRHAQEQTQRDWAIKNGGTLVNVEIAQSDMEALRERVNELKTYFPPVAADEPNSWNSALKSADDYVGP